MSRRTVAEILAATNEEIVMQTARRSPGPWSITTEEFPADGRASAKLRFLLRYAVLAPSGHNTQPWRFVIDGDRVEVHADRAQRLEVVDPADRALTISC